MEKSIAEIPEIVRDARHRAWGVDEKKIRKQIKEVVDAGLWKQPTAYLPTYMQEQAYDRSTSVNPREKYHLDTTKIFFPEHRERLLAWQRGEHVAPITLDMALTQKCSFSCTYCYAGLQGNKATPATWETYKNLIDDFVEIGHRPGQGVRAVSLVSDGESTENEFFYDFVLYGKSRGIDMSSGTNGFKLDPARFPELLPALTYIRFNISAGEKEAYKKVMGVGDKQWEQSINNIREAVRVKRENNLETTIGLQMVLLPQYGDQVIPLALLTRELGADYLIIKHCSDDEHGSLGVDYKWYHSPLAQDLIIAAEGLSTPETSIQAKWSKLKTGRDRIYNRCFGPPLMLQISGTGVVAPCGSFFSPEYKKYQIGNFVETRFKDLWASDRYWDVLRSLHSPGFNPQNMCATLCLQDKVNEALFDWQANGKSLPDYTDRKTPPHINFI